MIINSSRPDRSIASLAHAFTATLDPTQRSRLLLPYSVDAATNWSNLPQGYLNGRKRVGLQTRTLTAPQWRALENLLATALGTGHEQGFDQLNAHLAADDCLHANGTGPFYGRGNFFVTFLGTPSEQGDWRLQFGGHHMAVLNSYRDGRLVGATPAFRGIEPFPGFEFRDATHAPMRRKRDAAANLLDSLDTEQLDRARMPGRWPDLLLGPGADDLFPTTSAGITGVELSATQRNLLVAAMAEWVHDVNDIDARRILVDYTSRIAGTHLAFAGTTRVTRPGDYVRIDGPRVWIELSMHDGIVLAAPHPHSVWRDRLTDYGR